MYRFKKIGMIGLGMIMSAAMLSCGVAHKEPAKEPQVTQQVQEMDDTEASIDGNQKLANYTAEDFENAYDTRTDGFSEQENIKLYLLEELESVKIYMTADTYEMIVLEGDEKYIFDITCMSPHAVLPAFLFQDIDGDGEKEIVVDSLVGTGTGVSIDYLYVLDREENGALKSVQFQQDDMIAQLEEHFSYTFDDKKEEVQYYIDGKEVGEPFSIFCENSKEDVGAYTFSNVGLQDFIYVDLKDDKIELSMGTEGWIDEWVGVPLFINANVTAKVEYAKDGTFSVRDVGLEFVD